MNYIKYFNILGVNTVQIPCIELQGVPNTATEGAVGLLGINMLSDEHELYKCVGVDGGIYTWMPIKNGKDGISIVKTELNENCELIITFSDGTQTNLGVIRGEKGEKGEQADLSKIQEKNKGRYVGFWLGDTETFEKLESTEENVWYLFEDDTTLEEIEKAFDGIDGELGKLNTKVYGLENRTKAVENTIPLIEDDISVLGNELHGSMRFIQILYSKRTLEVEWDKVSVDVVSKPSSLSYKDYVCNYLKMFNSGAISHESSGASIWNDDGYPFTEIVGAQVSKNYLETRDKNKIYHIEFTGTNMISGESETHSEVAILTDDGYHLISIIESEMD